MNIYITKANEDYLRNLNGESMSGYINRLLEQARGATPLQVAEEGFKEALDEWPKAKPQDDWAGPLMRDKKKGKL